MAKSSRYMQGLLGVIASGRRRKPVYIRKQALVSFIYPVFIKPEFVEPAFSFLSGGRIWVPPTFSEKVMPAFSFLAGGTLEDFDPFINYGPEVDQVTPEFSFLAGGIIEDYDPFVTYTHPIEDGAIPLFTFRTGGFIKNATLRHTVDPEDKISPSLAFRTGGSLLG